MTAEDWVRIFNLVSSAILFYGSYRGQQWSKRQARLEDRAARQRPPRTAPAHASPAAIPADAALGTEEDFDRAMTEIAARPYFDRVAYILFCVGFAISGLASLIDLYSHGTFGRIVHHE
jgi:hypothetical protein